MLICYLRPYRCRSGTISPGCLCSGCEAVIMSGPWLGHGALVRVDGHGTTGSDLQRL